MEPLLHASPGVLRGQPRCPERPNPAFIPMFSPLHKFHSVVSQFHDMTWCCSPTLMLHGTEGTWRRCGRFQDKNCLVMGLGTPSPFPSCLDGVEAELEGRNGVLELENWGPVTHYSLKVQLIDLGEDLTSSLADLSDSSCWAASLTWGHVPHCPPQ